MKGTILFVGGGIETVPGIEIAKSMDLCVVVSDRNSDAPCAKIADFFIKADTYNIQQTIDEVRKFNLRHRKVDGVICLGTDVPLTVSSVAKEFGLKAPSVESAKIVSDKVKMKDCFKNNQLPIPWYCEISNYENLIEISEEKEFPLIIKPVDSRGARGVLLLNGKTNLNWAYDTALSYSASKRVMIEQFLDGPQVSTESIVINDEVFTFGFSDRNYELLDKYAPHVIENGGDLPSFLPDEDQNKIRNAVKKTAKALGVSNGIIKGDMVLCEGEPYIIEVATRLSGGYFCTHEIPLNTGIDFVGIALRQAMGYAIDKRMLNESKNQPVCQRYFFPKPGQIKEIIIPDWINIHPNISLFEIRVKVGDLIPETTHHPSRAGLVITSCDNKNETINLADKVAKEVCFVT